jgi:hypothetical protein
MCFLMMMQGKARKKKCIWYVYQTQKQETRGENATHTGTGVRSLESIRSRVGNSVEGDVPPSE